MCMIYGISVYPFYIIDIIYILCPKPVFPRNFVFRSREFEQMEIEYFIPPGDSVWQPVCSSYSVGVLYIVSYTIY